MILIVAFPKQICKNREGGLARLFCPDKKHFSLWGERRRQAIWLDAVTQADENLIVLFIANPNHGDQILLFFFQTVLFILLVSAAWATYIPN